MEYENILIREQTNETTRWCSQCERAADNCVCEEISDHFREVCSVGDSGTDVCVPAVSERPHRGDEQEPYTHEEAKARRREQYEI